MKNLGFTGFLFVILSTMACAERGSVEPPWETLFNGKDFGGWKIIGDKGNVWIEAIGDSSYV